jgi:aminoglycoside phosphotransferase
MTPSDSINAERFALAPIGIGDARFADQMNDLLGRAHADATVHHLLDPRSGGSTYVNMDFATGRRNDSSYRLRHMHWSVQCTSPSGFAARTFSFHRKDNAPAWFDFPNDPKLPHAPVVLQTHAPSRLLRYIPQRRLTYASQSSNGQPTVIKIKRRDRISESVQRLQQVKQATRQSNTCFQVPDLLSADMARACFIQSLMPGELPQHKAVEFGARCFETLGGVLHNCHGLHITDLPSVSTDAVRQAALDLTDWLAFMQPRVSAAFEKIREAMSKMHVEDSHTVFCHGDFNASQALVHGDQWTLLDFDRAHCGSAFTDIANFMAKLGRNPPTGATASQLDDFGSAFVQGYESAVGRKLNQKSLGFHIVCAELHHLQQALKKGESTSESFDAAMNRLQKALSIARP